MWNNECAIPCYWQNYAVNGKIVTLDVMISEVI
jgi:hypothetical protein